MPVDERLRLLLLRVVERLLERIERRAIGRDVRARQHQDVHRLAVILHRDVVGERARRVPRRDAQRDRLVAERHLLAVLRDLDVALRQRTIRLRSARVRVRPLDHVPIELAHHDLRPVLLLEVRRAAEVIEVAVADDDVFHVRRVEAGLLQRGLDDLLRLVNGVQRIDQDDALIRRDGPRADRGEAEEIEVVEQLDDVDLALRLGRKAGVLSEHRGTLGAEHRARLVEA